MPKRFASNWLMDKTSSEITFLQNEHYKMLQGLFDEIDRLQKKCSDQQFQLVMHNVYPSDEGKLKEKIGELEICLQEKSQECEELREALLASKQVVNHLEQELKTFEDRYQEDVGARNLIVAKLRRELDHKSATIAYMMSLHHKLATRQSTPDHRENSPRGAKMPVPPPKELATTSGRRATNLFRKAFEVCKSPGNPEQPNRRTSMPGALGDVHLPPINMATARPCHQDVHMSQRKSVSQGGRSTQLLSSPTKYFKP